MSFWIKWVYNRPLCVEVNMTLRRFCAGCGLWKRLYFKIREPERSLCSMCYGNKETHYRYGKGYMGPRATPPHPNLQRYLVDPSFGPEGTPAVQLVYDPVERAKRPPPWADMMGPDDRRRLAEKEGKG